MRRRWQPLLGLAIVVGAMLAAVAADRDPATADAATVGDSCAPVVPWAELVPPVPPRRAEATGLWLGAWAVAAGWDAPNSLYVAGQGDLSHSDDCGATWRPVGTPPLTGQVRPSFRPTLALAVGRDGSLYAGDPEYEPLMVSQDAGHSWQFALIAPQPLRGPQAVYPRTIAPSPAAVGLVYATFELHSSSPGGLGRSLDGGFGWEIRSGGFHTVADAHAPDTVYVSGAVCRPPPTPCASILSRSTDGGATFAQIGEFERPILALAMAVDGSRLWVATEARGMWRSPDRGATWERVFLPDGVDNVRSLSASPFDPQVLYLVTEAAQLWAYRDERPDSRTPVPGPPTAAPAGARLPATGAGTGPDLAAQHAEDLCVRDVPAD